MKRLALLILDGDSLRTPGLAKALERHGWEVTWAESAGLAAGLAWAGLPDLVLFDPAALGPQGLPALRGLRNRNPGLPLAALSLAHLDAAWDDAAGLGLPPVLRLERGAAPEGWCALLRAALEGAGLAPRKFTAEDLFGDILCDLDGPAPAPPAGAPAGPGLETAPQAPAVAPESAPPAFAMAPESAPPAFAMAPAAAPESAPLAPSLAPSLAPEPSPRAPSATDTGEHLFPVAALEEWLEPGPVEGPIPVEAAVAPEWRALATAEAAVPSWPALEAPPEARLVPAPSEPRPAPAAAEPVPAAWAFAAPASAAEPILEEFGNYNLLEKVAVGGMAELFKARQRGVDNFEKIVAIKRILPHLSDNDEFVRMFIDEAKLAAQLSHPNIAQIYDLGKASGFYYIAMEFVDGRDLRSLLRKIRDFRLPMPETLAATVIMKVANALDYAHRKRAINDKELKLVHRDISPQNILVSSEGAVKLVDFGIAKAANKGTQTQAGALKGKLLYMSPEQALGQTVDGRSDIYSLGLVLAELLTGDRCFQADSELGVLEKVRLGKVMDIRAANPGLSPEMLAILDRVLQRDADRRYASARLLERDLKALLVSRNNEPTEHDLAEYVNTLLKGTREEAEALLANRFGTQAPLPRPAIVPPPAQPAQARALPDDQPTLSGISRPPAPARAPLPARRAWRVPVLAGLVVALLLAAAWIWLRP